MIPSTGQPHRFRLSRAGIHQVWQYDEVFSFGGGRLLLRGKNGAGKSKALEMLLPFLLDGDTRRLDAAGGGKTTLKWLMLDGWTQGANRLGYLWVEFVRSPEDGVDERVTLGAAVRASVSTGEAKPVFFVTGLKVGEELPLDDPGRRPSLKELRDLVGADNYFERATDFRGRVARDLFGLTDLARYRNLVHLLYGLRRPTIGDRIESGELVKVLSDALPPLDDEVIDKVARNLDDLDAVREELARLETTDSALTTFLTSYRGYLRGVLRGRVGRVREALAEFRTRRLVAGEAERLVSTNRAEEEAAKAVVTELTVAREEAGTDLRALRESAAYGALNELRDKRGAVQAVEEAARSAWSAAEVARDGETTAAERLCREAAEIGREMSELRGALRKARRAGRSCGLDDALFGDPPGATATVLSSSHFEEVTDPGGETRSWQWPKAEILDAGINDALRAWREELTETDRVATARQRATDALEKQLIKVLAAESTAEELRREVERLDGSLAGAQERRDGRISDLVAAGAAYAGEVTDWTRQLPDPDPILALVALPDDDPESPIEERALDRDTPRSVLETAHHTSDPVLAGYDAERDEALAQEQAIETGLRAARAERDRWERLAEPEIRRSPYSTAERAPGTGAPLYLLVDFSESLGESERSGLEAALESSGLLNAWVSGDGTLLAADTRDVLLHADRAAPGPNLASVLRPIEGHGVGRETLNTVLNGIGWGESKHQSWVAADGRWRLGTAHGAFGKDRPEYVGAAVRAATRQRRIAELTARIDELEEHHGVLHTARTQIETRRDRLRRALRKPPRDRPLIDAWTTYDAACEEVSRLNVELTTARRQSETSRATAVRLRTQAEAQASSDGLPTERHDLGRIREELAGLRTAFGTLDRDAGRILGRLGAHTDTRTSFDRARQAHRNAMAQYGKALTSLSRARRELSSLEDAVGATEQELISRERAARRRFDEAEGKLPQAHDDHGTARDARVRAETKRDHALAELKAQEEIVVASGVLLRRPLGLPGLPQAAELGDVEVPLQAYDGDQDRDVRARITALRSLADDVADRIGAASGDVTDSQILRRGEELRDGLAGGYDAGIEETDGIKRFSLHDDTGTHDVAVVGDRIRTAAAEAQLRLSVREQEVFERYLLGELGDHLSRQVLAAHDLVATMNVTLDDVRSSHGIGARLQWELNAGEDADIKAAVALLRRASALRTREQSAQLRDALRRRIEDARLADPTGGYALHLRAALDYRTWFAFKVKVTDTANPGRERILSHRTALSQGEQRVVSYLVLFATAAAHFTSLGGAAPRAPRLILLDDAFAKVDEPTHGRLLGLLVELDLDFVITSERLWGCFATVPSLHIYECLRDPHVRGVATIHFTWDGHNKRLVSV